MPAYDAHHRSQSAPHLPLLQLIPFVGAELQLLASFVRSLGEIGGVEGFQMKLLRSVDATRFARLIRLVLFRTAARWRRCDNQRKEGQVLTGKERKQTRSTAKHGNRRRSERMDWRQGREWESGQQATARPARARGSARPHRASEFDTAHN